MKLGELILWPGTKACQYFGIDPDSDAGLIRWMINTLVYLFVSLIILWIVVT